jgi:hypothetical protein
MAANPMRKLYSITTNQAAIIALFRVVNPYVGWLLRRRGPFHFIPPAASRCVNSYGY